MTSKYRYLLVLLFGFITHTYAGQWRHVTFVNPSKNYAFTVFTEYADQLCMAHDFPYMGGTITIPPGETVSGDIQDTNGFTHGCVDEPKGYPWRITPTLVNPSQHPYLRNDFQPQYLSFMTHRAHGHSGWMSYLNQPPDSSIVDPAGAWYNYKDNFYQALLCGGVDCSGSGNQQPAPYNIEIKFFDDSGSKFCTNNAWPAPAWPPRKALGAS